MSLNRDLLEIREDFLKKLTIVQSEVMETAVAMLQEDIENPDLTGPDAPADAFMFRANQIGFGLFEEGFFAIAERMYRALVQEALRYREETGSWRHAGALYVNTAGACAAQGKLDQAVVELLKAAQDDVKTYKVAADDSYAITGLLQDYFGNPVRQKALKTAQRVNPALTLTDMEDLGDRLEIWEYSFLAYTHLALVYEAANQQFPNKFSQLQIFSALRSLSALLEMELKKLSGTDKTLFHAITALYGGDKKKRKAWWHAFEYTKNNKGKAIKDSPRLPNDQLRDAIAICPTDDDSRFWKSLLIAYIVRNYTIHQLETECALIQDYSDEVLGHILHVMTTAPRHM
jgi:hypothetical protein